MKQHILSQKQRNNVNLRFLAKKYLFATFEKEICFQELRIYITIAVRKKMFSFFDSVQDNLYSNKKAYCNSNIETVEGFHSCSYYILFLVNNYSIWNCLASLTNRDFALRDKI